MEGAGRTVARRWLRGGTSRLLLLAIPGGVAAQAPAYQAGQLACAAFSEEVRTTVQAQSGGAPFEETGRRSGILVVRARAEGPGLRFEAWYDSLYVRYDAREGRLVPDTDGLIGGRWEGTMTADGTVELFTRPFVPPDLRSVSDLSDVLLDFFPPLPTAALAAGARWTDSLGLTVERLRDSTAGGRAFGLYRWRIRSGGAPPAAEDSTVRIRQNAEDEGRVVWSAGDGAVAWNREVTIDTQFSVPKRRGQPYRGKVTQRIVVTRLTNHPACR